MKEYDTGEAISQVTKNEDLKFKLIRDNRTILSTCHGKFDLSGGSIDLLDEIKLDDKWTPVEIPVDFMTAATSTKNIRAVYNGSDLCLDTWYSEYHAVDLVFGRLGRDYSSAGICTILEDAEWYVQEVE